MTTARRKRWTSQVLSDESPAQGPLSLRVTLILELNVRDVSLLLGGGGADSPEGVNRELFAPDGWTVAGRMPEEGVDVLVRPPVEFRGRTLYPVYFRHAQFSWYQPFYRSTGKTMPVAAPAGSIWPVAGICTESDCRARGYELTEAGGLAKHYYNPKHTHWVAHHNDRTLVWPFLLRAGTFVAEHHARRGAAVAA